MRHLLPILFLSPALALAQASSAHAQDKAADGEAQKAQAEAAFAELSAQQASRAGDPAFDYQLAIAALDSGRYGEAIIALQRVLAVQPNNAAARAELARAYAMAGDIDTARDQFATVVDDPSLPDPVRQRFTGFVRQFDKQIAGGGSDVSGFIDASIGYDDNINAATDLDTITIPLFSFLGPGRLGAGAVAQGDEFYEVSGGVSGVSALGRQDRVFASVLGTWRDNLDSSAFDQASLTGTTGYAHSFGNRDVVSLSGQVQRFWLGQNGFRTSYGAIGQYTKALDNGRALTMALQWNRLEFDGNPLRDSDRFAASMGLATRTLTLNLSGGHEETRRQAGDHESNDFATASIGAEIPVAKTIALVGGMAFDLRRYDQPDPLFLTERKDERFDAQIGVKVALTDTLFLQPRASYSRNWSNIPLYDHERWTVSAAVRFEF